MTTKSKNFGPFQNVMDDWHKIACYRIIRFYKNGSKRTIKSGLTESEAQAHCKRVDTRGPGWFDGYDFVKGVKV